MKFTNRKYIHTGKFKIHFEKYVNGFGSRIK